ncbi:hypothetical protein [Paraburkholderia sp. CI3]|uniref:hypothetical protein n=1 Tax=Paraburkholderia sp. CI3 TaxID=2991060 RepID=UPI003D200517
MRSQSEGMRWSVNNTGLLKARIGPLNRPICTSYGEERRQFSVFVYIVAMAQISQISSISKMHGTTARAIELAITIKTITPKTITKR